MAPGIQGGGWHLYINVHHFRVDVQQNYRWKYYAGKPDPERLNHETTSLRQATSKILSVLQIRQALDNLYRHLGDVVEDSLHTLSAPLPVSADLPLDQYVMKSFASLPSCSCLALIILSLTSVLFR